MRRTLLPTLLFILALPAACGQRRNNTAPAGSATPYATVALPGGEGGIGFDDIGWDSSLDRVISPAGGTDRVDEVNPADRTVTVAVVAGPVSSATSGRGWLFAADRNARAIYVVDASSGAVAGSATTGAVPDYVRYSARTDELWVTEPSVQSIEIFSLGTGTTPVPVSVATISTPGAPEGIAIDDVFDKVYVHGFAGTLEQIDLFGRTVIATWPTGCSHSHGIPSIDIADGLVFATCDTPEIHAIDVVHGGGAKGSYSFASGGSALQAFSTLTRHVYLRADPGETVAALGVDPSGDLTLLGTFKASDHGHCLVADSYGALWVCDSTRGALLEFVDLF